MCIRDRGKSGHESNLLVNGQFLAKIGATYFRTDRGGDVTSVSYTHLKMPIQHDEVTKHKKPDWLKIRLHNNEGYSQVAHIVREHGLHTICSSGRCPNQAECWSRRTATFMILGEICTRSCKFCATASGKPLPPDSDEPRKLARSVSLMRCV